MPTYAELEQESWWMAEREAPAHAAFNTRLRTFYGHTWAQTGSKGDYRHLRGRHRSRNWCLNSRYCTDRSYATTHTRDKAGDGDWLRATDVGISGLVLREASKRLDTAVRAGKLPCVAEWFGTIDGQRVVGWYQGSPSSSDDSHLWHLHVGLWTDSCGNADQLRLLGDIITGEDDMQLTDVVTHVNRPDVKYSSATTTVEGILASTNYYVLQSRNLITAELAAQRAVIEQLAEALKAGGGSVDMAAIDERLAALRAQVEADTRDAVADLAEGGATQVRAD